MRNQIKPGYGRKKSRAPAYRSAGRFGGLLPVTTPSPARPKPSPPQPRVGSLGGGTLKRVVHVVGNPATHTTTKPPVVRQSRAVNPPRPGRVTPVQPTRATTTSFPAATSRRKPVRRSPPRYVQASSSQTAPPVDLTQQYVDASVNPQLDALDRLAQFQAQQQQTTLGQFNQVNSKYLQALAQEPAQVQQDYERGQQQQLAAAQLSAQALAAANPNAQVQHDLQAIGAPQAQQDQVAQQLQNTFQGGAANLTYLGGTLPANALSENEAARLAFARALPAIAQESGNRSLQAFLKQAAAQQFDVANQRANVTASIPKLRLEYQSQQASNKAKQQQLNLERAALGLKTQNQKFQQGATAVRLGQTNRSLALRELQSNRQWQLGLQRVGISEAGLKLRAAISQSKMNSGGFTASQVIQFRKRAGKVANDAWNGVPVKQGGQIVGYNHQTYQHALSDMLAQGIPLTVAQQALNVYWSRAGLVAPFEVDPSTHKQLGGAGRPLHSYQQRQTMKKAKKPKGRR